MSSFPPPSPVAAPGPEPADAHDAPASSAVGSPVDLDRIAQDLVDVEVALERLDEGTYWTCEVTGEPLPDELLAADPVARRHPSVAGTAATRSASPDSTTATW
jgi:RNA polymerase-binding transcription factor DksA